MNYFKYIDVIRTKKGKIRKWKNHDRVAKGQAKKDREQWK